MNIDLEEQSVGSRRLMEPSPTSGASALSSPVSPGRDLTVRHFRQIVLWPLQFMPIQHDAPVQKHCDYLQTQGLTHLWREVEDEFTGDPSLFQGRHYSEFITFLPSVQRFLYGEGTGRGTGVNQESPIRVFRRSDVAQARMTYPDPGVAPVMFEVAHIDLYFFYDIDLVILAMEIFADGLPLDCVKDTMLRFAEDIPRTGNPKDTVAIV